MSVFDIFLVLRKVIILSRQKVRQQKNTAATSIIDCFVKNKDKNSVLECMGQRSLPLQLAYYLILEVITNCPENKLMHPIFLPLLLHYFRKLATNP